jgi:hypothetical protein
LQTGGDLMGAAALHVLWMGVKPLLFAIPLLAGAVLLIKVWSGKI